MPMIIRRLDLLMDNMNEIFQLEPNGSGEQTINNNSSMESGGAACVI